VRIKPMLIFPVALVVAILSIGTSVAMATSPVSQVLFGASTFNTSVSSSTEASLKGSATLNGKLEVKAIMPHGLPMSQRGNCHWGDFAWSDWETSNGGIVWAPAGHHGRTHACLVHGVWRQIGGGPGQWNCGNVVKPIGAPLPPHAVKLKMSQIVVVKHFVFTIKITVTAEAKQEASAMAACELLGVNASSSVHATGLAVGSASATGKATSKSQALTKASAEAVKILSSSKASLFASAQANASVKLEGQATAFCQRVTQPPPPPHEEEKPHEEPKEPGQPRVTLETIQEIETGEENRTICAHVKPPAGDTVTVEFDAVFGSFTDGGRGIPQAGTDRYCNGTYRPPTSEPPHVCVEEIASELPPGTKCDTISVFVQSSNGSKPVLVTKEVPIVQEKPF